MSTLEMSTVQYSHTREDEEEAGSNKRGERKTDGESGGRGGVMKGSQRTVGKCPTSRAL